MGEFDAITRIKKLLLEHIGIEQAPPAEPVPTGDEKFQPLPGEPPPGEPPPSPSLLATSLPSSPPTVASTEIRKVANTGCEIKGEIQWAEGEPHALVNPRPPTTPPPSANFENPRPTFSAIHPLLKEEPLPLVEGNDVSSAAKGDSVSLVAKGEAMSSVAKGEISSFLSKGKSALVAKLKSAPKAEPPKNENPVVSPFVSGERPPPVTNTVEEMFSGMDVSWEVNEDDSIPAKIEFTPLISVDNPNEEVPWFVPDSVEAERSDNVKDQHECPIFIGEAELPEVARLWQSRVDPKPTEVKSSPSDGKLFEGKPSPPGAKLSPPDVKPLEVKAADLKLFDDADANPSVPLGPVRPSMVAAVAFPIGQNLAADQKQADQKHENQNQQPQESLGAVNNTLSQLQPSPQALAARKAWQGHGDDDEPLSPLSKAWLEKKEWRKLTNLIKSWFHKPGFGKSDENEKLEVVDLYRDTPIRLLGYANEVGEAFRPMVAVEAVKLSYVISTAYVLADTVDKSIKVAGAPWADKEVRAKEVQKTILDTVLWQGFASIIVPGLTINRACWASLSLLDKTIRPPIVVRNVVTAAICLALIPVIVHPIDHLVDKVLDMTVRPLLDKQPVPVKPPEGK